MPVDNCIYDSGELDVKLKEVYIAPMDTIALDLADREFPFEDTPQLDILPYTTLATPFKKVELITDNAGRYSQSYDDTNKVIVHNLTINVKTDITIDIREWLRKCSLCVIIVDENNRAYCLGATFIYIGYWRFILNQEPATITKVSRSYGDSGENQLVIESVSSEFSNEVLDYESIVE